MSKRETKATLQARIDTLQSQLDGIDPRPRERLDADHAFLGLLLNNHVEPLRADLAAYELDAAWQKADDLAAILRGMMVERRAEIERDRVPDDSLI